MLQTSTSQSFTLSPSQAAKEIIRRLEAKESLIRFTEFTLPTYVEAAHHTLIAEKLEAVERGKIDRLMINMPPRHGKSELASRRFPAWFLGRHPHKSVIAASYNSDLAADFGRQVRNIVNTREYANLFQTKLAEDSRAANRWNTSDGGAYVAAGVGTAITGRGADILLIDDPVKDREEADSEIQRQKVWDWYTSTAYTRLAPGGRIIVIQTRWHEDDLSGRLIAEQAKGGDKWDILELPAITSDGKALWPEFYPLESLERTRRVLPARDWSALYQQRPAPDEGAYFKREWFRYYDDKPAQLRTYGASDYAVTDGDGDYTVHVVIGVDADDNIFVLDVWRNQTASDVWIESWLDMVRKYKPLMWGEEQGQIVKSIGPFLDKRMREAKVYCRREQVTSAHDKPTRSRSIQARTAMGKVYLPIKAPWLADFTSELLTFPAGKHDDQVDAFGLIGRMLDDMVSAAAPKVEVKKPVDGYRKPEARDSWRTLT
jgi:predicted phage terminase large subunit-like protein